MVPNSQQRELRFMWRKPATQKVLAAVNSNPLRRFLPRKNFSISKMIKKMFRCSQIEILVVRS